MGNLKRVMISLPNQLLQEVDGYVKKSSGNRSEFIREAMKSYLEEKKRQEIREQDARRVPVGARPPRRRAARGTRTRLVYVSPLKALSYDVEKNLRAPLRGIGADVTSAIRTGDTPQKERAAWSATRPTCSSPRPSRCT